MAVQIDLTQALEAFRKQLAVAGVLTDAIITDGEIHRCGTAGKEHKMDGAYLFHPDPPYSGWYHNYRTGIGDKWTYGASPPMSPSESKRLQKRILAENAKRREERRHRHAAAAEKAREAMGTLPAATADHPYLIKKGVAPVGDLRIEGNKLVVPILGEDGRPQSIQHILPNGEKRFLIGGKIQGGYFPIKGNDGALYIVEGLATGLSVHEATGQTVLCAFNAGNLKNVALLARSQYPDREIIIAGDNDCNTEGNPGRTKAIEAAQAVGAQITIPEFSPDNTSGTDFNDLHAQMGIGEVKNQVKRTQEVNMDENNTQQEQGNSSLHLPADFPRGIYPPVIEGSLLAASKAFNVPFSVPAVTFLVAGAAAIGCTRCLCPKKGWDVFANFFLAIVAESGMGKTPCSARIMEPLHKRDYAYYEEYLCELELYEAEKAKWEKKARRGSSGTPDVPKPTLPRQKELYLDDATMEKVGKALEANQRGILWYRDELAGLFADLGKYSSKKDTGDKARLLSANCCKPWKLSRATKQDVYIPRACVTLFGTIQPEVMKRCFSPEDKDSGLLQRLIFIQCVRDTPPFWVDDEYDDHTAKPVNQALEYLLGLDFQEDGEPYKITFNEDASETFKEWFNGKAWEIANNPELQKYRTLAPKQNEQMFKLCLILHLLECWADGRADTSQIVPETVIRATTLEDWIIEHRRQVWDMFDEGTQGQPSSTFDRRVAVAILELKDEIQNGHLPTSRITEHLNIGVPAGYEIKAESVGRTYKKLGLSAGRGSSGQRGVAISPDQLERLEKDAGHLLKGKSPGLHDSPTPALDDNEWDGSNEVGV